MRRVIYLALCLPALMILVSCGDSASMGISKGSNSSSDSGNGYGGYGGEGDEWPQEPGAAAEDVSASMDYGPPPDP